MNRSENIFSKAINFFRYHFANMKFRNKLFWLYFLAAVIPFFISQVYSYNTLKNQLISQTKQNVYSSVNQININIENKLDKILQISSILYSDQVLKGYLSKDYSNNVDFVDAYYGYINKYFPQILVLNTSIDFLRVYTPNSTLPSDGYFIFPLNTDPYAAKTYDESVPLQKNIYYENLRQKTENRYVFTMYRLLDYQSLNYPYGVLAIDIQENELYTLIEKESSKNNIYIVNESGVIFSCKDKNLLNKNISQVLNTSIAGFKNSGSFDMTINGEKSLVVYTSMQNKWRIISTVPYGSFLETAQVSSTRLLVLTLFILILSIILVYLTSKLITKRITYLSSQVKKLESGNFDIKLKYASEDELGQLSKAFHRMATNLKILIKEVYEKEILKRNAEMDTLQSQINPHFLYNTLSSISALAVQQNDYRVNEMVNYLSRFYRISLNNGKKIVTVREEIELTKNYISIQQIRFQDLLHITYDIDESLFEKKTIKLILQPMIENSINHGLWNDESGINIIIRLYKSDSGMIFEVIDDGVGISPDKQKNLFTNQVKQSTGYSMKNVNERIKLYFGEDYGVTIFSRPGIGTYVKISTPNTVEAPPEYQPVPVPEQQ